MEKGVITKPKRLEVDSETLTASYGKFTAEPLERGFGTTIGNSLRRVLLSSIQGAAVTSMRIEGVSHEFSSLPGMKEDIADFVLNVKQLRVKLHGSEPRVIRIDATGPREVTAGDITTDPHVEVLNKGLHLATLNGDGKLKVELTVKPGRGFSVAERNKEESQPLGVIVIDAFFTPIERVNYRVENARVGQATDYDRLVIRSGPTAAWAPRRRWRTPAASCASTWRSSSATRRSSSPRTAAARSSARTRCGTWTAASTSSNSRCAPPTA